jgi:hypothetical protein
MDDVFDVTVSMETRLAHSLPLPQAENAAAVAPPQL